MKPIDDTLINVLMEKIQLLDKDIEKLQLDKQTYLNTLNLLREQTNDSVLNVYSNIANHIKSLSIEPTHPLKPGQALLHLFEAYPYKQWTADELVEEFKKLKSKNLLISSSKILWTVHNGLRILDKRNPKPILKKGTGRSAYYIKNPDVK